MLVDLSLDDDDTYTSNPVLFCPPFVKTKEYQFDVSRIDLGECDQIVETSTFLFGDPEDPPFHDLFVVESKNYFTSQPVVDTVMTYVETLGDLGKVVDFGAGYRRPYCTKLNVVEHVEWRSGREKCICGCEVTPFCTPFYRHKELDTFIAINSLQNNSFSFVQRLMAQIKVYGLDFVIVQPMNLNKDEFDVTHVVCGMFAGVEITILPGNNLQVFTYISERVAVRIKAARALVTETCVKVNGTPISRDDKGSKQSVLIYSITDDNDILVVEANNGGPVDFIAAGHVTYGETPIESAKREWREEMVTPLPFLEYYGVIKPPVSVALAYVFVCRLNTAICQSDRGHVRVLRSDDICRHDFYPAIRALNAYFKFSDRFDLDNLCSKHYSGTVKSDYKRTLIAKYAKDPKFERFCDGGANLRLWAEIYKKYKIEYHQHCRVAEADLKSKFKLDMRTTNQAARIYSPVVPGSLVVLNSDNLTPCPIVSLEYEGRQVGYCSYMKVEHTKRIYRVVECNAKFDPSKYNTIINYTFKRRFDTEVTDTCCGANLLAEWKGCSYDEAVSLIRSGMAFSKLWSE